MILDYLIKFHIEDCINILSEKDVLGYYNIKIDFLKLFETYPDVGDKVLCNPVDTLLACDRDVIKAQQNILEGHEYRELLSKLDYHYMKRNVYARFYGLPVCPELHRTIFPKNADLGCFLKVTGTVVRVTQTKMLEYQRHYVCTKCKYENSVEAEFEHRYILRPPKKCGNTEMRCRCTTFAQVNLVSREYCKDYQEIKIQEQINKLSVGTIPGSMWVILENDLVDYCKPGDDVIICGTVRRRWRPSIHNSKSEVELVLQANYLEVSNAHKSEIVAAASDIKDCFNEFWSNYHACPLKGRDHILSTVCPQVYGLHLVKLAVLLTVITGSNHIVEKDEGRKTSQDDKHTTSIRGQCHLLLVGDPGTGKSQLLRAGSELTARSVLTSGAGSTKAGLTCAALRLEGFGSRHTINVATNLALKSSNALVTDFQQIDRSVLIRLRLLWAVVVTLHQEDGEWQLEAGALVLSDGGVCCIDEISHLREHDRTAIHEAMEQQTISIAKAGMVCKLNSRCAVIAACNPKGHYQTDEPLSANVSLGTPLLSRFDLIFILLDSKNKEWDKLVSSYILFGGSTAESKNKWSLEKLQMYISLVGPRSTQMTESANIILHSYYMVQRKSEYRDPSRTTVRMLDSLVRLSQAHCRLMYRTTILPMDAIVAVSLVDLSMQDYTLSDTVDALHSTFKKFPDYDYLCTAKKLLTRLNLNSIWREELLYYGKLLQVDHKTLEDEIEKESFQIFSKYNDVIDDNIPLTASLVTSSYFKTKNLKEDVPEVDSSNDKDKENAKQNTVVNDKLAATLKKHAALNKDEKKPPLVQKRKYVRKRKEVTIDSKHFDTKKPSKARKTNDKDIVNDDNKTFGKDISSAQEKSFGESSSKDLFMETEEVEVNDNKVASNKQNVKSKNPLNISRTENENNEEMNTNVLGKTEEIKAKHSPSPKTVNKLKQFQFVENHDLNKFYNDKIDNQEDGKKTIKNSDHVQSLHSLNNCSNDNISGNHKSRSSSQISMFENSDYEIDLDI